MGPNLQFFKLASGQKVSMCRKFRHEYHPFAHLDFPLAAILNFCFVMRLPILLYTIVAAVWRPKNSKWQRAGNLKPKTGDIRFQLFGTLKLSFHLLTEIIEL